MPTPFQTFNTGDVIFDTHLTEMQTAIKNLERGTAFYGGLSTGTSVAYQVSLPTPPDSPYQNGMMLYFKPHVANAQGAPNVTLSVNGGVAKPILRRGFSLFADELAAGGMAFVIYDSAAGQFHLLKPALPKMDDLSDVIVAAPTQGQVIQHNGSAFVNSTDTTFKFFGAVPGKIINKRSLNTPAGLTLMGGPPSGKRWLVMSVLGVRGPGAGSNTLKVGFQDGMWGWGFVELNSATLVGTATQPLPAVNYPILESGDQLAHNASAAGSNVFYEILEFSTAVGLRTVRATGGVGSINLYTCPTGKTAKVIGWPGISPNPGQPMKFTSGSLYCFNASGTNGSLYVNVYQPGDSLSPPGVGSNAVNASAQSSFNGIVASVPVYPSLQASHSLYVNSSFSPARLWATIQEFPG